MNTTKKRFAPKKRLIKHFLSLTLAGSLLLPGLVLIRSEPVEANIIVDMASGVVGKLRYNATVAEIIVSLLAGSGAGVTNTNYLNQLNNSYGINSTLATATGTDGTIGAIYEAGLFSIGNDGTFIDNGLLSAIESQPAYTNCNINDVLGTWNEGTVVETGAAGIGSAIGAGTVFGTICQVAGSFMVGYNLGNAAVNFVNQYYKNMALGVDIQNVAQQYYSPGARFCSHIAESGWRQHIELDYPDAQYILPFIEQTGANSYDYGFINFDTSAKTIKYYRTPNGSTDTSNLSPNYLNINGRYVMRRGQGLTSSDLWRYTAGYTRLSSGMANTLLQNNATVPSDYTPKSPDVVNGSGNLKPSDYQNADNVNYWPGMNETVPDDKGMQPIPWADYMDWVDTANTNTTNNVTNIQQGDVFNNFIENYYVTPTQAPDVESPDYNPTVPEQPTPNPKEELTSEVVQDNTDYMTTPGLKDVFPFSIPWDIAGLFNIFSTNNREAPVITFPIVSELFGIDEEITIDFSPYDDVAALLRLLELIAFGLGLAFVTRYLIGAGG